MNDQEYLNVMAELNFIASVGENQYINLTTKQIENRNVFNWALRKWYYNWNHKIEDGTETAKYCRNVVLSAFKLLDRYTCSKDKHAEMHEYAKTIQNYILEAKRGMDNLKETHKGNFMANAIFISISVAIVQRTSGLSCCGERITRED